MTSMPGNANWRCWELGEASEIRSDMHLIVCKLFGDEREFVVGDGPVASHQSFRIKTIPRRQMAPADCEVVPPSMFSDPRVRRARWQACQKTTATAALHPFLTLDCINPPGRGQPSVNTSNTDWVHSSPSLFIFWWLGLWRTRKLSASSAPKTVVCRGFLRRQGVHYY
jgi:hypothetical protein